MDASYAAVQLLLFYIAPLFICFAIAASLTSGKVQAAVLLAFAAVLWSWADYFVVALLVSGGYGGLGEAAIAVVFALAAGLVTALGFYVWRRAARDDPEDVPEIS